MDATYLITGGLGLQFAHWTIGAFTDYLAMEVLETKSSGDRRGEIDNDTVAQLQVKKRAENLFEKEVEKTLIKKLEDTGYWRIWFNEHKRRRLIIRR